MARPRKAEKAPEAPQAESIDLEADNEVVRLRLDIKVPFSVGLTVLQLLYGVTNGG